MHEDYEKRLKIITIKDAGALQRAIDNFKKDHEVIEIKQHSPYTAFIFYKDLPKELKLW